MKNWKGKEIQLTQWLSSNGVFKATRRSRAQMGESVEDISWGPFSVELKTRKTVPKYLLEWMAQAERNAGTAVPVVVIHQDHASMGDQLVMLRLSALLRLIKQLMEPNEKS